MYTSVLPNVKVSSTESFELQPWYPFLSSGKCGNVSKVDVIDKWLVEDSKGLQKNTNLFPNKISGFSMGFTVKAVTRVVAELAQSSKKETKLN
jgi:hypothetical protein